MIKIYLMNLLFELKKEIKLLNYDNYEDIIYKIIEIDRKINNDKIEYIFFKWAFDLIYLFLFVLENI